MSAVSHGARRRHSGVAAGRSTHSSNDYQPDPSAAANAAYADAAGKVQITMQDISPGAVGIGSFAGGLAPVHIVMTLPILPLTAYPEGTLVVLTTNGKLYRNVAGAWSAAVAGDDVVASSIVAGTITAGALSVAEIVVHNGALTLMDEFGATVMVASGFTGSWLSFIRSGGIYNSDFAAGLTTDIPVSEVSGGDSIADYAASMTANLPYWVVESSGSTLMKVTDTNAKSGFALEASVVVASNVIYQDVPIEPGSHYLIYAMARLDSAGGDLIASNFSWRDATHGLIGTIGGTFSLSPRVATTFGRQTISTNDLGLPVAPGNAAFLRIRLNLSPTTTSEVRISSVSLAPYIVMVPATTVIYPAVDHTVPFAIDEWTDGRITFTPVDDCWIDIEAFFDVSVTAAGAGVIVIKYQRWDVALGSWVDWSREAHLTGVTTNRATIPLRERYSLPAGQLADFRLLTVKTVNGGTAVVTFTHTRIQYTIASGPRL